MIKAGAMLALLMNILGASAPVQAQAGGGFAPPELAIHQLRDNIYLIRSAASGNVTVLVGESGIVLIDDKFEQDHDGIMTLVRSVSDQPIRYVINTHLHQDHSGGNAMMQAINADVIASENARQIMAETQSTGLPNIIMRDYLRIYLDETPIDLHYFGRGHTDGDVVIHLPEERIVVTGDLFALWGPYAHLVHYAAGGSIRDWPRSLERALALDFDTVIPGHSGVTDRAMMEGFLEETLKIQKRVREMKRENRSRDEIGAMMQSEFGWSEFMLGFGLDGMLIEMQ